MAMGQILAAAQLALQGNPIDPAKRPKASELVDLFAMLDVASSMVVDYAQSNIEIVQGVKTIIEGTISSSPAAAPYFNVIVGHGAKVDGNGWRNTAVGALAFSYFANGDRNEAYGQGAMRFAKMGTRNTAIGSLSLQWLGDAVADLAAHTHDLYDPKTPSDPTWDMLGFETANPGIRAKIVAAQVSAVIPDDVQGNVGIGRNTLLDLVTGSYNTAGGYNALAHALYTSYNTALGYIALRDNMLGQFNVGIGALAGATHQEGNVNVFVGYTAGKDHISGDSNVMVGGGAGVGWATGDRNVIIGYQAGQGVTPSSDMLVIQNLLSRAPLIGGRFALKRVGINAQPTDIDGTFHVFVADSTITANAAGQSIVVESNANHGISILGGSIQSLYFGDTGSANQGGLQYNHSTDEIILRANGAVAMRMTGPLPTAATGLSSGAIWRDAANSNVLKMVP